MSDKADKMAEFVEWTNMCGLEHVAGEGDGHLDLMVYWPEGRGMRDDSNTRYVCRVIFEDSGVYVVTRRGHKSSFPNDTIGGALSQKLVAALATIHATNTIHTYTNGAGHLKSLHGAV